jgi:CCR4-NOT transcription complex subunit 3
MLDSGLQYPPEANSSEKPISYMPNYPYPTPGYYPQIPYSLFEKSLLLFEKFDIDTLFFIFYYQQGTYQQYSFK